MLSPQASRHLKQWLELSEQKHCHEEELRQCLTSLASRENVSDLLAALPPEKLPLLKEALLVAAQDAVDADCLSPEESVFQEHAVSTGYYMEVAKILLQRSAARPRPAITVVCLASFEVEWALRVRGSAKIGFTVVLTEAEEKIWCHADPRSIPVRVKQKSLETPLGESLCDIWKRVLHRTRHPKRDRIGRDGVSYHFACSVPGGWRLAGRTWSPERETIPGRLVAISHALRAYLEANEEESSQAREHLDSCIALL